MKSEQLSVNTMLYSRRYGKFGMCIAKARFMAYMLFVGPDKFTGWYHCQELEKSCYDNNGKIWSKYQ